MSKIWVISDQHIHHAGMLKHGHRLAGYEDEIYRRWLHDVADGDIVVDLGDVILGKNSTLTERLKSLPGIKVHCRGNHDARSSWFETHGYALSVDYFVRRGICFSHRPIIPLPPKVKICLHGHFHGGSSHRSQAYDLNQYYAEHRERYRLVEIESYLGPRLLEDIVPEDERRVIEPLVRQIDPEEE